MTLETGSRFHCSECGAAGNPKESMKGSKQLEIILWCCLLVPGFIYGVWRSTGTRMSCPKCGSTSLVPEMVQPAPVLTGAAQGR